MTTILKRTAANVLTLASVAAIALGIVLQAQTPYGFALFDGGGRMTDLGAVLLVLLPLVAVIVALFPLARYVDEHGLWRG